ncbi:MAG: leucine-rich repeat domain-containing protein [Clostridia bacterium]|nr:leucine-rich repeat domain-containing protein [Clostridia bacterium]
MKTRTKKILYSVPIAVLLLLCGCLIWMLPNHEDKRDDLPVMGTPEDTTTAEAPESDVPKESETEPAPEETTEEEIDLSSKGLLFESLGDGTCLVSGIGSCRDSLVVLPEKSPAGDTVVGIGAYAFRDCDTLKGIELTAAVRSIGAYAFYGSALESVSIPAETLNIGEYAFCGCYSLGGIEVSPENPIYADENGVLMSKSGEVIICYPAGRADNFYSISAKVREIRTMAFYNCPSIKLIHYAGGATAFRQILIGAGNEAIESAVITYSSASDLFTDGSAKQDTPVASEK